MSTFVVAEIDGKPTVKNIEDPLPAGTNILGKVDVNATGGLALEATLATLLSKIDFEARINTLGQKAMTASTPVTLATDQSPLPTTTTGSEEATYTAMAQNVLTNANGKSVLALFNPPASGYTIKLREIYVRNPRTAAITGILGYFRLHALRDVGANVTGGTAVTAIAHDSADAIPAGLVISTGGTVTGEIATPLDKMTISTDEWGPGTLDVEGSQQAVANYLPARTKRDALLKPFYARAGEGLHMKFDAVSGTPAGELDFIFVFTKV